MLSRIKTAIRRTGLVKEPVSPNAAVKPYAIKVPVAAGEGRRKVLHLIANFWTGGSARLVVDLIEHLGDRYEQEILTRDVPPSPAYTGVRIQVCTEMEEVGPVLAALQEFKPDFVHIHYLGHHRDEWGEEDWKWYRNVFAAVQKYGCKVVENINIPTDPFRSETVSHYVYVSEYVKDVHSVEGDRNEVIYPGSDFTHFSRSDLSAIPDNCIGMVYRLERDKINEQSIDVFIEVLKRRKGTRALIVGGGNLMQPYRNAVAAAGLTNDFIFTGYVAYDELPELYKKISVFVAPVHRESFGQVTPFAMHMGIPVAGYEVGALPEIIANRDLLASPANSSQLADIIIGLLDDPGRRLQIGAENHRRAKELFSVEAMIERYTRIYNEMAQSLD